ncbi:hypothetical protein GQ42DRAFT_165605 [Ramicandelaber brevisporus]|nr:hypothetical protein GQ42DRAFT_165605 [Ramicandelaber brevisporus]
MIAETAVAKHAGRHIGLVAYFGCSQSLSEVMTCLIIDFYSENALPFTKSVACVCSLLCRSRSSPKHRSTTSRMSPPEQTADSSGALLLQLPRELLELVAAWFSRCEARSLHTHGCRCGSSISTMPLSSRTRYHILQPCLMLRRSLLGPWIFR